MRSRFSKAFVLASMLAPLVFGLDGQIGIHDPSTVIECGGKYYVYGTGGSALVSDDGWTWRRGTRPSRAGLAPDVIRLGDKYYMYVANNTGVTKGEVHMIWSKTLDPDAPGYKWEDGGIVASSDGIEESNAIDPGVFLDPNTGRLWLVYGSYFGFIRQVELNPKTGERLHPGDKPRDLAVNCEASDMIFHDGWYYLLATHGSCCRGAESGYNIRVGRSKSVNGPFVDNMGIDMIKGGGTQLIGTQGRNIGPGHFGLIDLGNGIQKFSLHYEADLNRGGASVLDIRPLLWKDGWPVAGENLSGGTFMVQSPRNGNALELAVEGVPVGGAFVRRPRPVGPPPSVGTPGGTAPAGPQGMFEGRGSPIPDQDVAEVSKAWPQGTIGIRMSNYMSQAQQKWSIMPVANAGGYLGSPFFRISIAGTERTLTATSAGELEVLPAFSGAAEQLWRIDQLADGNWRVTPKSGSSAEKDLALTAIGSGFASLEKFSAANEGQRWSFRKP